MTENKLKEENMQELTNSLYLINGLYEQMSNERDHLTSTTSKIVNATKQFQGYLEKFEDQEKRIPILIQQSLHKESENIAKMVAEKTYKEIRDT